MNAKQQGSSGCSEQDGNSSDRKNSEENDPPKSRKTSHSRNDSSTDRMETDASADRIETDASADRMETDASADRMETDASAEHLEQARRIASLNDREREAVYSLSDYVILHERQGSTLRGRPSEKKTSCSASRRRPFYAEIGVNPRAILPSSNVPMHGNESRASYDQPLDLSFLTRRNYEILNSLLRSGRNLHMRVRDGKNKRDYNSLNTQLKRTVCQLRNRNCYHRSELTRRIPSSTITSSSQQEQASGFDESFCTISDWEFFRQRIRWHFEGPHVQPLDLSTNSRAARQSETQQSSRTCYFQNQQGNGGRTGAEYDPLFSDQQETTGEVNPPSNSDPIIQGIAPRPSSLSAFARSRTGAEYDPLFSDQQGTTGDINPPSDSDPIVQGIAPRPSSLRAFARSISGSNSIGEDGSCWQSWYNNFRRSGRQPLASGSPAGTSQIAECSAENRERIQGENCENMQEEHDENACDNITCELCRILRRYSELCTLL